MELADVLTELVEELKALALADSVMVLTMELLELARALVVMVILSMPLLVVAFLKMKAGLEMRIIPAMAKTPLRIC